MTGGCCVYRSSVDGKHLMHFQRETTVSNSPGVVTVWRGAGQYLWEEEEVWTDLRPRSNVALHMSRIEC